ncbi:164_t:CDS:2 [Diversispora eburnea]|uniref:164_t:CDS:1 n=1 Tax=Diversispora eburnea TaxID=1213867 RepID=A0A9N9AHI6_9GLOM|nr:164_t:CDS:2 [Diversispora eburnea]
MGGGTVDIKVRNLFNDETRKLTISSYIKWHDLENDIKSAFSINSQDGIMLNYLDHEGDEISVSSDNELSNVLNTLEDNQCVKFSLVIKSKNKNQLNSFELTKYESDDKIINSAETILHQWFSENLPKLIDQSRKSNQDSTATNIIENNNRRVLTYPTKKKIQGEIGEAVEMHVSSQYLTFSYASMKTAWGTGIYTTDSDLIKGHSGVYTLSKQSPPDHDLSVILRFVPGCDKYFGSINNSLRSAEFQKYKLSFVIESVKHLKGTVSL